MSEEGLKILGEIEIRGTDEQISKMAKLSDEINHFKKQLKDQRTIDKEIAKTNKIINDQQVDREKRLNAIKKKNSLEEQKLSAETVENVKTAIKEKQRAYRDVQKDIDQNTRAVQDGGKSLDAMRAQLAKLNKAAGKLEPGTEAFKEASAEANAMSAKVKEAEGSMGTFNRDVGNYENSITSAFKSMGIDVSKFSGALQKLPGGIDATSESTGGLIKRLKVLRIALIATAIGAIAIAVVSLAQAFFSTQRGTDALNRVLIPLRIILQRIWGMVQELADSLVSAFKDPQQLIKDLWELLKSQILNRINGVIDMFKALGGVIKAAMRLDTNELKQQAKDFGNAYVQTVTGVEDALAKAGAAVKKFGKEVADAAKEGSRIEEIGRKIDQVKIDQARNESRIKREMEEQRELSRDVNLSDEERIKAAEEYLRLQDSAYEYQERLAALELERLQLKAKQNDTDRDTQLELAKAESKQEALMASKIKERQMITSRIAQLRKSDVEEVNEAEIEAQENALESYKEALAQMEEERKRSQMSEIERELDEVEKKYEKIMELARAAGEDDAHLALEMEQVKDELLAEYKEEQEEKELEALREFEDKKKKIREQLGLVSHEQMLADRLAKLKSHLQAGYITEAEYAKKSKALAHDAAKFKMQMALQEAGAKLDNINSVLSAVGAAAGEESAIAKAAAMFAITVDTYKAATAALSTQPPWLGIIMASVITAQGLMSLSKVSSEQAPKFAHGVIGLQGKGTSTSDSIDARLSKGESVMTAKATRAFAPVMANMERAVGNEPNYDFGNRRFATGIIGQRQPNTEMVPNTTDVIDQAVDRIARIPVVVNENDITTTQRNVRQIEVEGDMR